MRGEFSLFGIWSAAEKHKCAKLEWQTWPCPGGTAKKVRWHLTYERTHFFGVAANVLNRIVNMPQAKRAGKQRLKNFVGKRVPEQKTGIVLRDE